MADTKFKRILCPIDGSSRSYLALNYAIELAKTNNATVKLVFVVNQKLVKYLSIYKESDPIDIYERITKLGESIIQKAKIETNCEYCDFPIEEYILKGDPVQEIVKFANENADLIIISPHNKSRGEKAIIGNVTSGIIQNCSIPVLIIP